MVSDVCGALEESDPIMRDHCNDLSFKDFLD